MDDLPAPGLTSMIRLGGQKPLTSICELWMSQIGVKGKKWRSNPFGGQNCKKIGLGQRKMKKWAPKSVRAAK